MLNLRDPDTGLGRYRVGAPARATARMTFAERDTAAKA